MRPQKSLLEYKRPELANAKHSELNGNVRQTTPSGAQTNLMAKHLNIAFNNRRVRSSRMSAKYPVNPINAKRGNAVSE